MATLCQLNMRIEICDTQSGISPPSRTSLDRPSTRKVMQPKCQYSHNLPPGAAARKPWSKSTSIIPHPPPPYDDRLAIHRAPRQKLTARLRSTADFSTSQTPEKLHSRNFKPGQQLLKAPSFQRVREFQMARTLRFLLSSATPTSLASPTLDSEPNRQAERAHQSEPFLHELPRDTTQKRAGVILPRNYGRAGRNSRPGSQLPMVDKLKLPQSRPAAEIQTPPTLTRSRKILAPSLTCAAPQK
ncbi:hypothetical protein Hypma_005481 [Hypsizygus marmoreus]|uniref:Uncharacterized protein n=1 Tax=Hypsizygus marmoreus TaxID=39966 RepID=A0A369J1L9_HYPMA|nr:hypothetical protein Hypma_005481 [Hypsizygus marmoreus]